MEKVLAVDLETNAFVYLDDIIILSDTLEKHLELLEEITQAFRSKLQILQVSPRLDKVTN